MPPNCSCPNGLLRRRNTAILNPQMSNVNRPISELNERTEMNRSDRLPSEPQSEFRMQ
ncbi:hypothetical protein SKAU_G00080180, partial [Synaphobranchus kaupii]